MKKLKFIVLAIVMIMVFSVTAFADSDIPVEDDSESMSRNYTADQSTLDALYQEHLSLRGNQAELSAKQADLLLAMGVGEVKLSQITNGEVADLLKTGKIVKPEYMMKYVDEDALVADAANAKVVIQQLLRDRGLDETQIATSIENGMVPWRYDDNDNSKLLTDLNKLSALIPFAMEPRSTSCNIFTGSRSSSLLNENNVHYQSGAYPTYTYYNGATISLPRNPTEGTLAYTAKCDILENQLNDVYTMSQMLYGGASCTYNGYLWCEESSSSSNAFHEGVDLYIGSGASLYSIMNGTVISKIVGSSNTLSKLIVYDPILDVTVHYLHGNWSSAPSSGSISLGDPIGTEDTRGEGGYHTHIGIMSGRSTTVPYQDSAISTIIPYGYFWTWCS